MTGSPQHGTLRATMPAAGRLQTTRTWVVGDGDTGLAHGRVYECGEPTSVTRSTVVAAGGPDWIKTGQGGKEGSGWAASGLGWQAGCLPAWAAQYEYEYSQVLSVCRGTQGWGTLVHGSGVGEGSRP